MDRGLLYGHTVFETVAVVNSKPRLLNEHFDRLVQGAIRLSIPLDREILESEFKEFCASTGDACIRITLSIGEGGRGYNSPQEPQPLRILSEHEYPKSLKKYRQFGVNLGVSELRMGHQPALAGIKHGNRLEQILARKHWLPEWQEALLLDQQELVIEANSANVFIAKDDRLYTPSLEQCGVAGVMRAHIMTLASQLGIETKAVSLSLDQLLGADEVFLCNSLIGIWPVVSCQNKHFNSARIAHTLLEKLILDEVIPHH